MSLLRQLLPSGAVPAAASSSTAGRSARARESEEGRRFLAEAMRGHWALLGTSTGVALVWTAAVVTIPQLLGRAVNVGILGDDEGALVLLCLVMAALGVLQGSMSGLRRWTNGNASYRLEAALRQRFFSKLLSLEVAYHDQVNRGQLLSRVTSDLFQIQSAVASSPSWVANSVTVVAVAIVLVLTNPLLGAVAVVGLPFITLTSKAFSGRVRPSLSELQRERGNLAGIVEETVEGVRAVKGFGAEPVLARRLGAQADAVRTKALEVVDLRTRFVPVLATVPLLELVAVNWLGGVLVLHHELTVGTLLAFDAYIGLVTAPLQSIGGYIVLAQRAIVSASRLQAVMSRSPAIAEPPAPSPLPEGAGELRFESVRFAYPGARGLLFDGVDLEIEGGELVAIVGPTGSGKSTLPALVSRLYDPDAGVVRLDGVDVSRLSLEELRSAIAVVFEENFLFEDTVRANLCLGRSDLSEEELDAALALAQAREFVHSLPEGLDTVVGERGLSLSGGQRQRLALARALLAEPRVLVLDDATSAIDASNERVIVSGLSRSRRGRTTILVSHRPATIASADRVVLLEEGAVLASGTHEELARSCPRYLEVLGGLAGPDEEAS